MLISTPLKKLLPRNHLLENNYFPSAYLIVATYLLLNQSFFQEISILFKLVWSVVFLHFCEASLLK